jgi:hypothetical protein
MPVLSQADWHQIFIGDIAACPTPSSLRRWAANFRDEIKAKCPEHVVELRNRYKERLAELKKGCAE